MSTTVVHRAINRFVVFFGDEQLDDSKLRSIVDEVGCLQTAHVRVSTSVCLSFGPIGHKFTASVTQACVRRPGAAASVSRRRRERRILLAGGGRRASRSHTLAASQAFERMHVLILPQGENLGTRG